MTKKAKRTRKQPIRQQKETNWIVIGGFILIGVVGLFALLYASLQEGGTPTDTSAVTDTLLQDYCANNPDNCVVEGDADAPITVVEISDYGCGHCANFNLSTAGILKELYVATGQVKWVVLPFALGGQTGYPTLPSVEAAMCANEQDQFAGFHTGLFGLQSTASFNTDTGFLSIADSLGLDQAAFSSCLLDDRYNDDLLRNIQTASAAGVNATPSFFVNGEKVEGNLPLANFQQLLDDKLN